MKNKKYSYEVWCLGYTADYKITDFERCLGEFTTPDEALDFYNKFTQDEDKVKDLFKYQPVMMIQVEQVAETKDGYECEDVLDSDFFNKENYDA